MRPLLVITHLADRALGLAGRVLAGRGIPLRHVHLDGERPGLDEVAGLLVLGGAMGVPDAERYPFLRWELELLERALAEEVPVLGLCLGGQLLARAGGGRVRRMKRPYLGWTRLARLAPAADDPLFGALPAELEVLEWHNDRIEVPPRATPLAETDGPGASVFRIGPSAWGSQIHLELTPAMLHGWLEDAELRRDLVRAGVDPDRLAAEAAHRLPAQGAVTATVFERFADVLERRALSGPTRPPFA